MVSHINIAVDDDVFERAKAVKEQHNWSWADYIEQAAIEFEDN